MKKLLLIILILLPCNLRAQEGCGKWVKCDEYPRGNLNMGSVFIVWIDGHYEYFDSVWVLRSCIEAEYDTVWDHYIEVNTVERENEETTHIMFKAIPIDGKYTHIDLYIDVREPVSCYQNPYGIWFLLVQGKEFRVEQNPLPYLKQKKNSKSKINR